MSTSNEGIMPVDRPSQYTCVTCLQLCSTRDLLIRHVFSHYLSVNKPVHICQDCGRVFFNVSKLCAHNFQESKKVLFKELPLVELACAICSDTFSAWCSLTTHVFTHVSAISNPLYVSSYCSKVFKDMAKHQFHEYTRRTSQRRNHHDYHSNSRISEQSLPEPKHIRNCIYQEPFSLKCYSKRLKYKHSDQVIQSSKQSPLSEMFEKSLTSLCPERRQKILATDSLFYNIFEKSLSEPIFSCEVCEKSFTRSWSLKIHKKIHVGDRPYPCEMCGKTYTRSWHLKDHKRIHFGERPFSCKVCGKSFTQSGTLLQHMQIHSGERPFSCEVCGKSFTALRCFKNHKRIHSGDRLFSCDVCAKSFTESGSLKKHNRIHSGDRPFACDICSKSFTESGGLKNHKRIHSGDSPFACDVCGKPFRQSSSLKRHRRIHSGDRPFACDVGAKSFTEPGSFTKHKRIHSGKR